MGCGMFIMNCEVRGRKRPWIIAEGLSKTNTPQVGLPTRVKNPCSIETSCCSAYTGKHTYLSGGLRPWSDGLVHDFALSIYSVFLSANIMTYSRVYCHSTTFDFKTASESKRHVNYLLCFIFTKWTPSGVVVRSSVRMFNLQKLEICHMNFVWVQHSLCS
jgi:hypothetical protein